ncbi:Hypothetical protein D9617_7g029770 [Elsinoe fawcettii]|nr:Hypothetical protein D9617_7g029770 [Elsinoe fawcettii]
MSRFQQPALSELVLSNVENPEDYQSTKALVRLAWLGSAEVTELLLRTILLMQESDQLGTTIPTIEEIMSTTSFNTALTTFTTLGMASDLDFLHLKPDDDCSNPSTPASSSSYTNTANTTPTSTTVSTPTNADLFTASDPVFTSLPTPVCPSIYGPSPLSSPSVSSEAHEANICNLAILLSLTPHLVRRAENFLDTMLYRMKLGPRPVALGMLRGEGRGDMFAPEEEVVAALAGLRWRIGGLVRGLAGRLRGRGREGQGARKEERSEEGVQGGCEVAIGGGNALGLGEECGYGTGGGLGLGMTMGPMCGLRIEQGMGWGLGTGGGSGGYGGITTMGSPAMGWGAVANIGMGAGVMSTAGAGHERKRGRGEDGGNVLKRAGLE